MTDFMQYEKGCSPCAIQRKYGLTYVQGYELAERLKKTQELTEENKRLKERNESLNNRDIKLCRIANEIRDENFALKELLKRVVNATNFYHEIKTASVIDYGAWYNIANEIKQALGEDK